jgi:hypothetical protein
VLAGSGKPKFTSPLKAIIKRVAKEISGGMGLLFANKTVCCRMQVVLFRGGGHGCRETSGMTQVLSMKS